MCKASPDFRLLGPLEVVCGDRELTPARLKQRSLLAFLVLRANEVVATDELVHALWGEHPPATAQTALHGHVSALRKLFGREAIETRPPGYLLRVAPERTDVGRFQTLVAEARQEPQAPRRVELLRDALALFRGEPLGDFRYEDFARAEIQRLEELRLTAIEEWIEAELELGRHAQVIGELEALTAEHPLRERPRGQLMVALYRADRQAEALRVYQDTRQVLTEQLGLDPGPALRELEGRILAHDPSLAALAGTEAQPARQPGPEPATVAPAARAEVQPTAHPHRERKLVTVLFCDLAGFTARGEELDPEDLQALLDSYFGRVRELVGRFGGTIEKFIGDAVMAVFGAPQTHEDDPERAVRAAVAIREALAEELELRIAVHTGEALVTLDDDAGARQGIVVGDVVNTASRLQESAPPGRVIVGEATYRATERAIEYRELEPVVARGKRHPIPVWEVLRLRIHPSHRGRGAVLVGRQRELDQLDDALSRARAERTVQLATVVGVPGIGKTRLVHELRRRTEDDETNEAIAWLQGRSLPYGEGITFWALGEIVKGRAGIFEGDPPQGVDEKLGLLVEETLGAAGETGWVLRHLRPLVGLSGEGVASGARRDEPFAAWRTFLEALADQTPLVLVFEDLHWADDRLVDFVDELVERATDVPMLVVCTSRPELLDRRSAWGGGKRNAITISLSPLSDDETELLLNGLLEPSRPRWAAPARLAARAGGNPLYAEEYARLVLEGGAEDELALPDSLHALIAARLDALPRAEKAVVQDAAVVGETVWAGAIAAVGDRDSSAVEELVRPLERKEFLARRRRSAVEGEGEYAFHHVLVRDVAYAEIPRAERGVKHRRAAVWIESLGPREDHSGLLAHHYLRALELAPANGGDAHDLMERARRALTDAGERAMALGALHAAAEHFGDAVELVPEGDPERHRLLLRQGRALLVADVAGEDVLLAALQSSTAAGDDLAAAQAESLLATLCQEEGRGEAARVRFARALSLIEESPASREKGEILAEVCRSLMMAGEDDEALRVGSTVLEIADRLGLDELRAHALVSIGPSRSHLGDLEGGIEDLERAIEIASAIDSPEAVRGYGNLGATLADCGQLGRAIEARLEGQRLAERFGLRWYVRWFRFQEVEHLYFTGSDWDQVLRRIDDLIGERSFNTQVMFDVRARVRLARGDGDGAMTDVDSCLALARKSGDAQVVLPALAVAALVDLCTGRDRSAATRVDELLPLLRSFGAPTASFVLPSLAVVLDRLSRGDELLELGPDQPPTPWWQAACAYAAGDFNHAAATYAQIGSRPDEAYARLRAAEQLISEDRQRDATEELDLALAYFRSVGATAYIDEAAGVRGRAGTRDS